MQDSNAKNINGIMSWLLNFLFSGIGIVIFQGLWGLLKKHILSVNDVVNACIRLTIVFVGIIILIVIKCYRESNKMKKKIEAVNGKLDEYKSLLEELHNINDDLARQNDISVYLCDKYEKLEDFYKNLSSIIDLKSDIKESFITKFISQIEYIVLETASSSSEKIYVSIFDEREKNKYCILMSNYHSEGTKNSLVLNQRSFVSKIFKGKKNLYIEDIDKIGKEIVFIEREGREFNSILGIPYIVNDRCKYALVITAKYAGSLNDVNENYISLLNRYTQVIGYLMLMKTYVEEKKDA